MEMYPGPEQRTTETYMIPGTGPNPHLPYVPQLEEVDYMGTEVAPEYIYDQGLYYPPANYYGYYCTGTGFESPGEWDDHSRVFGVDGQDLHYSGLQTESLPYVYYAPSYGFAQSPYNPYNPYIPGAVMGLDGSYLGTQQYAANPSYQTPVSSPAYIPVVVQPSTDVVPNSTQGPSLFNTGVSMASRPINTGAKYTPPLASTNVSPNIQRSALGNPTPEASESSQTTAKSSEGALVIAPSNNQSLSQGTIAVGSATHAAQVRNSSVQAPHHFSHGRVPTIPNSLKVAASSDDSFPQFGSNIRGWATADKFRPRLQFHGDLNNLGGAIDVLGEQNKGPRTSRLKSQWTPASVGVNPTKSAASGTQQIIISADQFNRDDFPVNYSDAKFFVIKSYSEDDVHKSIKYKVWSSTANGNKRLDSAYQDAQRIILGQPRNCHIFLFFSVNASGQFCGVAEMIGPVNFDKDMDFWQQDKWTGSFPVKWHIVKDVPNTSFRHIILENNENKPVTNSRDTQEIPYIPGLNMLNIFKGTPLKTSILDDFIFYEERERIMQEDKARILGRSYDASQFLSAVFPVGKSDGMVIHPSKADEKQSSDAVSEPLEANERHISATAGQPPKADGKPPNGAINRSLSSTGKQHIGAVFQHSKTDGKLLNVAVCHPTKADEKGPSHAVSHSAQANWKPSNDSIKRPPSKSNNLTNTDLPPPKADMNSIKFKDCKNMADEPSKADEKEPNLAVNQPAKADGKPSNVSVNWPNTDLPPRKADRNSSKVKDPKSTSTQPAKMDRKDTKSTGDQRPKPNRKDSKVTSDELLKLEGINSNSSGDQNSKAEKNPSKLKQQDTRKLDSIKLSNDEDDTQEAAINSRGRNSTLNVGSRVVDSREGAASSSRAMVTESSSVSVVTVGSVPIRVEGLGESSSSVITVGTIPIDPKNLKPNKQAALAGGRPHQKYQK